VHPVSVRQMPQVVTLVVDSVLSPSPQWTECQLEPDQEYRLVALVEGTEQTEDVGALIEFEMADPFAGGEGLRTSKSGRISPHMYFRTGPGLHRTDRIFTVAQPVSRIGLRAWNNRGPVTVRTLTIEPVAESPATTTFFFSFDVEATLHRSPGGSPIDSLVWGRIGGGVYGIPRICDILEQHGVIGNFLIDFGTCATEGEAKLAAIIDYIGGRGHELHVHLHPDRLVPQWGLQVREDSTIDLDVINYDVSRRLLDYAVSTFERLAGRPARVFRSGAYRMNADLVLAAGSLGIEALSNVRKDVVVDPTLAGGDRLTDREPFVWENGVVEIPVDSSSPEAGAIERYVAACGASLKRKRFRRTYNVVMHSFSLLRRNAHGVHDTFAPEYEANLHQMCEHAVKNGRVLGYGAYLDEGRRDLPTVHIGHIRDNRLATPVHVASPDTVRCPLCDLIYARSHARDGLCPSCRLGSEHRVLRHVLDSYGDVFAGQDVLAIGAHASVPRRLLNTAAEVRSLDWTQTLDSVTPESVDVVAIFAAPTSAHSPAFLGQVTRCLRPGGVLVAVEPPPVDATPPPALAALAAEAGLTVAVLPGFDPVVRTATRVLFAYRAAGQN
jgi:Predicted O-methyltransferase